MTGQMICGRRRSIIKQRNGLMSFITHPDYLLDQKDRALYESLLDHLRKVVDQDGVWAALPGEVHQWWRARREMKLVANGSVNVRRCKP
jgi:hypothetical protein